MTTFIFLHGSWHAAWNWHKVIPLLEQTGHKGVALDLPGHGRDRTRPSKASLDRCVDKVLTCVDAQPAPAVLVAHSRNGVVISQAAERRPARITGLVYLAAYLVPHGKSMMEYAVQDEASLVVQNTETRLDRRLLRRLMPLLKSAAGRGLLRALLPERWQTHRLKRAAYRQALYHDCPDDIIELANALLEPEPNWAGFTPLQLSALGYGCVPKVYVECLQDRAVTLDLQRQMHNESPCDRVFALDTGHSPFFSQPEQLVQTLIECLSVFAQRTSVAVRAGFLNQELAGAVRALAHRRGAV